MTDWLIDINPRECPPDVMDTPEAYRAAWGRYVGEAVRATVIRRMARTGGAPGGRDTYPPRPACKGGGPAVRGA